MLVQIGAKQLCRHNVIKIGKRRLYALQHKRNLVTLKSDIMLTSNPPLNPYKFVIFSPGEFEPRLLCVARAEVHRRGGIRTSKGFQNEYKGSYGSDRRGCARGFRSVDPCSGFRSSPWLRPGIFGTVRWRRRLPRSARQSRRWLWRRQRLITPKRDLMKNTRGSPRVFFCELNSSRR